MPGQTNDKGFIIFLLSHQKIKCHAKNEPCLSAQISTVLEFQQQRKIILIILPGLNELFPIHGEKQLTFTRRRHVPRQREPKGKKEHSVYITHLVHIHKQPMSTMFLYFPHQLGEYVPAHCKNVLTPFHTLISPFLPLCPHCSS